MYLENCRVLWFSDQYKKIAFFLLFLSFFFLGAGRDANALTPGQMSLGSSRSYNVDMRYMNWPLGKANSSTNITNVKANFDPAPNTVCLDGADPGCDYYFTADEICTLYFFVWCIAHDNSPTNMYIDFNLNFNFNFAGTNFNSVRVNANGILQFPNDNGSYNNTYQTASFSPIPIAGADRAIFAYGRGIEPTLLRVGFNGKQPNRTFVVSWIEQADFDYHNYYTYQVVIHESNPSNPNSGKIVLRYGFELDNWGNAYGCNSFWLEPCTSDWISAPIGYQFSSGKNDWIQITSDKSNGHINAGAEIIFSPIPRIKFLVTNPSSAIYCQGATVTIRAQNAQGGTDVGYADQIQINNSAGSGTWSLVNGKGKLTNTSNGGAMYQFSSADAGVATFQLSYTNTSQNKVSITVSDGIYTDNGQQSPIYFYPYGFMITGSSISSLPDPVPAFPTQVAAQPFNVYLTAYGKLPNSTNCGIIQSYNGSKKLYFSGAYINPGSGAIPFEYNPSGSWGSFGYTSLYFNNGQANIPIRYRDVGTINVTVQDFDSSGVGAISGSTGNFTVAPYQIRVLNVTNSGGITNPGGSPSVSGAVFATAGTGFNVTVASVGADGNNTPNFGRESPMQSFRLQSNVVMPTGGQNGVGGLGLQNNMYAGSISNGQVTMSNVIYSEVGYINITAGISTGSYLGTGRDPATTYGPVGRFVPAYYQVQAMKPPQFAPGCTLGAQTFTYLRQPISFAQNPRLRVSPMNAQNINVLNYTQGSPSMWRLPSVLPWTLTGYPTSFQYNTGIPVFTNTMGAGYMDYNFDLNGGVTIDFPLATPVGSRLTTPFKADFVLAFIITDADNVSIGGTSVNPYKFGTGPDNGISWGGTDNNLIRQGRIYIPDTIVPKELSTVPVEVMMQAQYYNNSSWVTNADENCLTIVDPNATTVHIVTNDNNISLNQSMPGSNAFQTGQKKLTFQTGSPGGTVLYQLNLEAALIRATWLQFAWPYMVTNDNNLNPRARIIFNVSGNNNNVIYKTEIINAR